MRLIKRLEILKEYLDTHKSLETTEMYQCAKQSMKDIFLALEDVREITFKYSFKERDLIMLRNTLTVLLKQSEKFK